MKQKKQFPSVLFARGAIKNIANWFGGLCSHCTRLGTKGGGKNIGLEDLTPRSLIKTMLLTALFPMLLIGCSDWTRDKNARRQFDVCIDVAKQKERCRKLLHFDLMRSAAPYAPKENEYIDGVSAFKSFDLNLAADQRMLSSHKDGQYQLNVKVTFETAEQVLARYQWINQLVNHFPVNETVGTVFTLTESDRGEAGTSFSVPSSGNIPIFFKCTKPFRAIAGNLVTHTGCTVYAELSRHVFIEYPIYFKYLQEWESIHKQVLEQLAPVLTVTYITQGN